MSSNSNKKRNKSNKIKYYTTGYLYIPLIDNIGINYEIFISRDNFDTALF